MAVPKGVFTSMLMGAAEGASLWVLCTPELLLLLLLLLLPISASTVGVNGLKLSKTRDHY
jgi:hypothetical protein